MDVSNGDLGSLALTLADGRGAVGAVMGIIGVALVAMLIGGFWLGKKRRAQEPPPPRPEDQPPLPDHRSHVEQRDVHADDSFPPNGRGLSPYELGDRGNQPIHRDTDEQRD
ncbi:MULTISPECIES: DUF6479 family protein [unclassified Streptomyces]|uniref:DUF6479 family protein n=1 Tax=unclassified Streptomyces TaxID=2593676 RepID=UPI002255F9E7|nr:MULTISPECIES: DUF6479 family protein [unclassified Streptomyces]WSP53390.1 DUF6479 family protein [Streptomyces sp. NBC_01241]WSU25938.1 DUF6479 family protein [Streptomyces sp. NBC_01108]MCX4784760.1 DUF6479 family protein [Streptomyces sp. NBC_01221]MCX4799282.1 DUF6479 family protein [Streptomyces sp. NBC_01242]WSJ40465.1 DUF6479 family protein [Streptomyces sp. NBC_01321]